MSALCKSCDATVVWAVSERGNTMIIDAEPVEPGVTLDRHGKPIPEGNVALEERGALDKYGNPAPTAVVNAPPSLFGDDKRYVDHHVRCAFADRWTKERRNRA